MKAAYVTDVKKTEIRKIPKPEPQKGEVLIRVKTVGVCGSDLHVFLGVHAFRKPPVILGHEVAGEVCGLGEGVTRFKIGDRVTVKPAVSCGQCEPCTHGLENLCLNNKAPGTGSWIGTFAEYFPAPEEIVYPIADGIDYPTATLTEPLSVAVHIMNRPKKEIRNSMAIIGCGSIGLLTLFLARRAGYKKIICIDPAAYNREVSLKLGAVRAVDPLKEDARKIIEEITDGQGVDLCIVAAGAPGILDQASDLTRKGGEIVLVAMITRPQEIHSYSYVFKEQTLYGAQLYNTADFEEALSITNSGTDMSVFVTQQMHLEEVQEALEMLSEKKGNVVKIILDFE